MKVWMDAVDEQASIPVTDGSVFAKVSRVTAPVVQMPDNRVKPSEISQNGNKTQSVPSNNNGSPKIVSPAAPAAGPERRNSSNLLNFSDEVESPTKGAGSPAGKGIAAAAAADNNDLLGFDMPVHMPKVSLMDFRVSAGNTVPLCVAIFKCRLVRLGDTPTIKLRSKFHRHARNEITATESDRSNGSLATDGG
jgi:hypothetical protein